MKKKILLAISVCALLVALFALSVSADNELKPQSTNAYGELSFFDEEISVGRTDPKYGFTPYMADGTTYARIVIGDGTTFYTFPTAYALSPTELYGSGSRSTFALNMGSLNAAMKTATGTDPDWGKANIYRIELPATMTLVNGGGNTKYNGQNFGSFNNVIEIYLQPNTSIKDENKTMTFYQCYNLETIHNLDTFTFRKGTLGGGFQDCAKLTSLTLNVCPEVIELGNNTFNGCTALTSVNLTEAFPNLKSVGGENTFKNCTNLESISSTRNDGVIEFPTNVTTVGKSAFYGCTSITALKFTEKITTVGSNAFRGCTGIKFAYFPKTVDAETVVIDGSTFYGCSALKAIALPDALKTIQGNTFRGCTVLTAVYLPASLEYIRGNKNADGAAFYENNNLYFTNEWFDVIDKDGNFLGESFKAPEKKAVYYFPSTLKSIVAEHNPNNTVWYDKENGITTGDGLDDVGISKCKGLNSYLVFPEGFTGMADQLSGNAICDENQRGDTLGHGMLTGCGSKENPLTLVFLGRIDRLSLSKEDNTEYITYMFANKANTSFENTKIGTGLTTDGDHYANKQEEMYIIFCHANKGAGEKYKVSFTKESVTFNGNSRWLFTPVMTLVEGASTHAYNGKPAETKDATCTEAAGEYTYCFCGVDVSFVQKGSDALGHVYNNVINMYFENNNYYADATYVYACPRCETDVNQVEKGTSLFTKSGFSASEDNMTDVVFIVYINDKNIKAYLNKNEGVELSYGLVASANVTGKPLSYVDGNVVTGENTVKVDMTGLSYNKLTMRVTNVGDYSLHCAGYVSFNGTISYLNHETVDETAATVSLSVIDSILNPVTPPPADENTEEEA